MNIYEQNEPAEAHKIDALEQTLGAELPDEYKQFLAQYNGGYPEADRFLFHALYAGNYFDESKNRAILDRFLSLYNGEYDKFETYIDIYQDRIPAGMIPVAHDPGGNLVCLAIKGDNAGKVFYWKHDDEAEEGETPIYKNIYFVADTFNQFLVSLMDAAER